MKNPATTPLIRTLFAAVMAVALSPIAAYTQDQPRLSAEEIARLMDNPVGELIQLPIQYDRTTIEEPVSGASLDVSTVKFIPTFPIGQGKWRLVNRFVLPFADVPNPFGGASTSGFSDLTYVGALTPSISRDMARGKLIWAIGPTLVFPTASDDLLGQGKYQAGPAAAAAYLGPKLTLGLFGQQWWSYAGDDARPDVSRSNLQYFWYVKLPNQWAIGAAPSITVDWNATGGTAVDLPLGIGVNKTLFLGPLPARVSAEVSYYAVNSGDGPSPDWGFTFAITPVIPAFILRGGP
jgi:hypothetical protein